MKSQFTNFQTINKRKYDLEERTAKFAETIIDLLRKLSINSLNK